MAAVGTTIVAGASATPSGRAAKGVKTAGQAVMGGTKTAAQAIMKVAKSPVGRASVACIECLFLG